MNQQRLPVDIIQQTLSKASDNIAKIILGKQRQIQLALTCLLGNGHLLIEDMPGVGKTTLALTIAKTFGLDFQRIGLRASAALRKAVVSQSSS